jgi:hypothetical protein
MCAKRPDRPIIGTINHYYLMFLAGCDLAIRESVGPVSVACKGSVKYRGYSHNPRALPVHSPVTDAPIVAPLINNFGRENKIA